MPFTEVNEDTHMLSSDGCNALVTPAAAVTQPRETGGESRGTRCAFKRPVHRKSAAFRAPSPTGTVAACLLTGNLRCLSYQSYVC